MLLKDLYGSMDDKSRECKEEGGIANNSDKREESDNTGVLGFWIRGEVTAAYQLKTKL